jgi:hypothetical protein
MGLASSQIVISSSNVNNITIHIFVPPLPSTFIKTLDGQCLHVTGGDRPSIDATVVNI